MITICWAVAMSTTSLGVLMEVVGATAATTGSFTLPALFYVRHFAELASRVGAAQANRQPRLSTQRSQADSTQLVIFPVPATRGERWMRACAWALLVYSAVVFALYFVTLFSRP